MRLRFDVLEDRRLLTGPGLKLNILADSIAANAGPAATTGTVTRTSADTSRALTVSLSSSYPSAASAQALVVIPAGQASADFAVDATLGHSSPSDLGVWIVGAATFDGMFIKDPSFKNDAATFGFKPNALTTQADGKLIAVGSSGNGFAVRRYNADGAADSTFPTRIFGLTSRTMTAQAVAAQPDGKIIVGGFFQDQGSSKWNMQLARLTADGKLDAAFGMDGWVSLVPTSGSYNEVWDLEVLPDGKILIGGSISHPTTYNDFAVARLDVSGVLDPSFGSGGYATTSFSNAGDRGYDLAVQPDGKILLAGSSSGGNANSNFAVVRWTANGELDSTFGSGGKVTTDIPGTSESAGSVAVQPDGKIVVAGANGDRTILVRYTSTGALDATFGAGGVVTKGSGGVIPSLIVQGDGTIVVGGSVLSRFDSNGADLGTISEDPVEALALQPDGRIVACQVSSTRYYLEGYAGSLNVKASDMVTVRGVQAPQGVNDSYAVPKTTTLNVAAPGVLANDVNSSGSPMTAVLVTAPRYGVLSLSSDGSFSYTPYGNSLRPDSFTYQVTTGNATSNITTVSLSVIGPNDSPYAWADEYGLIVSSQTTQLQVQKPGVLANDNDVNGQPITAVLDSLPSSGTVVLNADGSFVYTPNVGFYGVDRFTYRASDGDLNSGPTTVKITVSAQPEAVAESYSTEPNTTLVITAPGILANDSSPAGLTMRAVLASRPKFGTINLGVDGSFTYTPLAGFVGRDTFEYYVTDGGRTSATVSDTIDVVFINRPPVADDDAYSYRPNTTLLVGSPGVLANDRDPNGQAITAALVTPPAHGSLTLKADGSFAYTPAAGWSGADAFTYKVSDGELESAAVTVRLIVADVSGPPWTQRGGDAGHSNFFDAGVDAAGISPAWNQPLPYVANGNWAQSGNQAVAIDDMHVYRTSLDGYWASGDYHIIAYDLATGAPVWDQVIVGNGPVSAPTVADGKVYVNRSGHSGGSGGTEEEWPWLYVLDAHTGAVLQRQTYSAQWASDERPVIAGGQIIAPDGYYGGFSSWATSTLARQWNNQGPQLASPLAALDSQYVYAYDDRFYLRSTGAYQGRIAPPTGMGWIGSPVVSDSGRLLFNVRDSKYYSTKFGISSYDAQTRTPRWTVTLPSIPAGKAVGDGLIAVTVGQQLILLDEATGAQVGSWNAPETLNTQIILTQTHAFVQSTGYNSSHVYAINLETGRPDWTYENRTEGDLLGTSMEMALGSGLLVLSNDAFVTAFDVRVVTGGSIFDVQPDDGPPAPTPPPPVYVDLGRDGVWRLWDGQPTQISRADPQAIAATPDGSVFLDFGPRGLWRWTATDGMRQISESDPEGLAVGKDGTLFVDLGQAGLWKSTTGSSLALLNAANPQAVAAGSDGSAFIDFGQFGVWRWTAAAGMKLLNAADPETMTPGPDGSLFLDFGRFGLWRWTAAAGIRLLNAADPQGLTASADGTLFVDYGRFGLWRWTPGFGMVRLLEADPEGLVTHGGQLYVDFGQFGLWKWAAGSGFSKLDPGNPTQFLANSDGALYLDFDDTGLWTWKPGVGIQRLTRKNPQGMSTSPLI